MKLNVNTNIFKDIDGRRDPSRVLSNVFQDDKPAQSAVRSAVVAQLKKRGDSDIIADFQYPNHYYETIFSKHPYVMASILASSGYLSFCRKLLTITRYVPSPTKLYHFSLSRHEKSVLYLIVLDTKQHLMTKKFSSMYSTISERAPSQFCSPSFAVPYETSTATSSMNIPPSNALPPSESATSSMNIPPNNASPPSESATSFVNIPPNNASTPSESATSFVKIPPSNASPPSESATSFVNIPPNNASPSSESATSFVNIPHSSALPPSESATSFVNIPPNNASPSSESATSFVNIPPKNGSSQLLGPAPPFVDEPSNNRLPQLVTSSDIHSSISSSQTDMSDILSPGSNFSLTTPVSPSSCPSSNSDNHFHEVVLFHRKPDQATIEDVHAFFQPEGPLYIIIHLNPPVHRDLNNLDSDATIKVVQQLETASHLLEAQDYNAIFQMLSDDEQPWETAELEAAKNILLGIALMRLKRYDEAIVVFQRATRFTGSASYAHYCLGEIELINHRNASSVHHFQMALQLYNDLSQHLFPLVDTPKPSRCAMLIKLAQVQKNGQDVSSAVQTYREANTAGESDQSTPVADLVAGSINLGNLFHSVGDHTAAVPYYEKGITLSEQCGDMISHAWAHGNLGNTYLSLSQHKQAFHHLQLSLDLTLQHEPTPTAIGRAYNNLGTYYQAVGDLDKAKECYDTALGQGVYGQDQAGQARAYGNIGNVYMLEKNPERAVPHYSEVFRLTRDRLTAAVAHHNRGCAYFELAEKKKGPSSGVTIGKLLIANEDDTNRIVWDFGSVREYDDPLCKKKHESDDDQLTMTVDPDLDPGQCYDMPPLPNEWRADNLAVVCQLLEAGANRQILQAVEESVIKGVDSDIDESVEESVTKMTYENETKTAQAPVKKEIQSQENIRHTECDPLLLSNWWLAVAEASQNEGMYEGAIRILLGVVEHGLNNGLLDHVCLANHRLGVIKLTNNQPTVAIQYFEKAVQSYPSCDKNKLVTQCAMFSKLGMAHKNARDIGPAVLSYKRAIAAGESDYSESISFLAGSHINLGNLFHSVGDHTAAVPYYEKGITLSEQCGDMISHAWAHGNLGNTYLSLSKHKEAFHHLQLSLDLTLQHEPTPTAIGRAYNNLGTYYQAVSDLDKAKECYDTALGQGVYGQDQAGQARAYGNIGNVYMLEKNPERAVPHYSEVLRLTRDRLTAAVAHHNRGCAYFELGQKNKFLEQRPNHYLVCGEVTSQMESEHNLPCAFRSGLDLSVALFQTNAKTFLRAQDCAYSIGDHNRALVYAEQCRARTLEELLNSKTSCIGSALNTPLQSDSISSIVKHLKTPNVPVVVLSYTGTRLLVWVHASMGW